MRARLLVTAPLALVVLLVAASAGAVVGPTAKPTDRARAGQRTINLATYPAKRWIVQLRGAPLATYGGGYRTTGRVTAARLNVSSQASRVYMRRLVERQHRFALRLRRLLPGVRVQRTYQAVLDGLAVKMSRRQAARVRGLAGVRAVTPDIPYHLDMYSTPQQIGAPTLWGQVGGQAHAGEGVKVAVVDSGIFVRHDAAGNYTGNPCFDDTGYTAPGGYPKGDTRFTNDKVLVARFYPRPDDPPAPGDDQAIQGRSDSSPHGTHVAGTIACDGNTPVTFQGANLHISGVAPRAYLMNYRVFYTSSSSEDFQNGNAYTVELVKAIDDAVKDGADVISNSWGSSYQNTLAWPDPMIQAADNAVDAGVVMVFANGNSGPDTSTAISPAISPKVIGVGAVTKDAALVSGSISVTAPPPVPANLTGLPFGGAGFGPQATSTVGPAEYVPAQNVATNASSLGCSLTGDVSPFPADSLTGKIALIQRGTCNFSEKVYNAQRGGAIAAFVYNSVAGGDTLMTMGAGVHAADVTIPSWFLKRTDGLNMVSFANAHPGAAQAKFEYSPHAIPNPGDVVAGFSSRGPSQDKLIKPDVAAPGVDVLSSGYGGGSFPTPFTGFGSASGTSMATPHVAGSAALLVQLHHDWKPWQIKSALMTTATENVWLNSGQTIPAGVLDRGAGRIDLTKAGNPGLTVDQPSLSGGELTAGHFVDFNILVKDVSKSDSTWTVTAAKSGSAAAGANFDIVPGVSSISVKKDDKAMIPVRVLATVGANPGSYEGEVRLTNSDTGVQLHLPVWLRVIPSAASTDVLLIDDDGSWAGFPDYSSTYTSMLTDLGASYQYDDMAFDGLPSFYDLFGYKAVVIFTGDNDSFDTSGFFPSDQDTLSEWLDSGGRLWTTGQNFAEESDSNSFSSASLGRARLYHGYLGLKYVAGSTFAGAAPKPTATGLGPMAGMTLDLSPGADGAGNQNSIEASSPMLDNDTYQAADTMTPLFRQIGGTAAPGSSISFGRSSEPSLEEERVEYRYRSVSMGFGLEGLNNTTGFATRNQVGGKTLAWLLDRISFGPITVTTQDPKKAAKGSKKIVLSTSANSSSGAPIVAYRWDFGDKSHYISTTASSVDHKYKKWGTYDVRVEATDALGHRSIQHQTIEIKHNR